MLFGRKPKKKEGKGIVSLEDAASAPESEIDFHATTESALENILKMTQQEQFSVSLEKIARLIEREIPKSDVRELIKILARSQSKK